MNYVKTPELQFNQICVFTNMFVRLYKKKQGYYINKQTMYGKQKLTKQWNDFQTKKRGHIKQLSKTLYRTMKTEQYDPYKIQELFHVTKSSSTCINCRVGLSRSGQVYHIYVPGKGVFFVEVISSPKCIIQTKIQ